MKITLAKLRFIIKSDYLRLYREFQAIRGSGKIKPAQLRFLLDCMRHICRTLLALSETEYLKIQERLEKGETWEGLDLDFPDE